MKQPYILVLDDDPFVRAMLEDILVSGGYNVKTIGSGIEALKIHANIPELSLIISDMNMAEMNGLEFIRQLRKIDVITPLIVLTVNNKISTALDAIKSGATDYLIKDENIPDTILLSVRDVIEKNRLMKENIHLMADLRQKNEDMEKSNQKLEELSKLKNRFLGIAAHDLRTPIGCIISISDILISEFAGKMTDRQSEWLEMIRTASKGMLNLLNDLLDISTIESGQLMICFEKGSISSLIEDRIRLSNIVAKKKNINVHTHYENIPESRFDPKRISQIFDNLISNAINYSPRGSDIFISLSHKDDMIKVSIKDQGPGISDEDRKRLCGEFQRLSAKPTEGEHSTGLGLALVKKMLEAHHGILEIESQQGIGSTFSFKIPVNPEKDE